MVKKVIGIPYPQPNHYAALGCFIAHCSHMEIFLTLNMRLSLRIEEEVSRMMIGVGDLRVKDLIRMIKRVQVLNKLEPEAKVVQDRILSWCTYFNDIRNFVAHKPMYVENENGDELVFHDTHTVKLKDNVYKYRCTIGQLDRASEFISDLLVCLLSMTRRGWYTKLIAGESTFPGFSQAMPDAPLLEKLGLPTRPADKHQ